MRLDSAKRICVEVYDVLGRRVRRLADGMLGAGIHEVVWDVRDGHGTMVAAGTYFYRVTAGDRTETGKIVVVR